MSFLSPPVGSNPRNSGNPELPLALRYHNSFYVAASLSKIVIATSIANAVKELGLTQTYAWSAVAQEKYSETAAVEIRAVVDASIFIGIVGTTMGMNTETGAALALKYINPTRRVILYCHDPNGFLYNRPDGTYSNVFWMHPFVERVTGEDPAMSIVNHLLEIP